MDSSHIVSVSLDLLLSMSACPFVWATELSTDSRQHGYIARKQELTAHVVHGSRAHLLGRVWHTNILEALVETMQVSQGLKFLASGWLSLRTDA